MRSLCDSKNLSNLKCVIESVNFYPSAIGITETWLKKILAISALNYQIMHFFSKSRSKSKGGGVGFFICKNLTHLLRDDLSTVKEGCFESIFVEIKVGKFNIICGNVYRPPSNNSDLNNFFDILSLVLDKLKRKKNLSF